MASTALVPDRLARADLFRFLAACYYEPAPEFAEERLFDSLAAAAERVDPELAERARHLGKAFAEQSLDSLRVDYTRLFIGPSDVYARPYAAVWTEQETDVASIYSEAGFDIGEDFHERPDHIAVELEFLYRLVYRAADDTRRRFVGHHLATWIAPFCAAVQADAGTMFYRELACLTERVIGLEARCSE